MACGYLESDMNELIHAIMGMDPDAPPCEPDCEDEYCAPCAMRACPAGEPLHRHHDGCPSCDGEDADAGGLSPDADPRWPS